MRTSLGILGVRLAALFDGGGINFKAFVRHSRAP